MRYVLQDKLRGHQVYQGWDNYYQAVGGDSSAWKDDEDDAVSRLQGMVGDLSHLQIADLGCGDGRNLWSWIAHGSRVIGIDLAETALARILATCKKKGIQKPLLLATDFSATQLMSDQFDVVQCFDALAQVIDPGAAVVEMARIAKPDGLVCFNAFTPGDVAYGEGLEVEANAFAYNDTLFRFFEDDDILRLLPKDLIVVDKERRRWRDPPHTPFRPYEHEHEALYYVCRKALC
jgi:SAM-dependent methyltransferase